MGLSESVIFHYHNRHLEKRDDRFYWISDRNGIEVTNIEVLVETACLKDMVSFDGLESGPLIYRNESGNSTFILSENYLPTRSNVVYQGRPINYYKLTHESVWSKIYYVCQ